MRPMGPMARSLVAAILLVVSGACSPAPPGRPNVLLLMIDALRADHLGCYGYDRDTSPNIDRLASESVLFVEAWSQSPWTKPSIPTLFTSLYPMQHGVYEGETPGSAGFLESDVLWDGFETLAEAFRASGFRTIGFVNNAHLLPEHGFAQGFDVYEQADFPATEINAKFLAAVDETPGVPFFAYLHYLDVHWPFQPAPPFDSRFGPAGDSIFDRESWSGLRDRINDGVVDVTADDRSRLIALHDGGIAEMDARIGELLEALRARGLDGSTVVALTSDHGEELLDHGKVGHGGTLHQEVLRIPMMIRVAGEAARRVESPARLLDVYPTLLRAAGIEVPGAIEGRDLLVAPSTETELVAETRHKQTYRVAVRSDGWKYVKSFRAPTVGLATDRPETFGLQQGMRIKVKGWFGPDGTMLAEKISIREANDDDVEVSGPVADVDAGSRRFSLHTYRVVPTDKLEGRKDGEVLNTLREGEWVKAEGDLETGTRLLADKLERLEPDDRDTEIEAIVQEVTPVGPEQVRLVLANTVVIVTDETRIKGGEPTAGPSEPTLAPGEDPFTPQRLLAADGFKTEERLYDVGADPLEQIDRASSESGRLAAFRGRLAVWLERMARTERGDRPGRSRLDEETVERLRTLGYVE